MLRLRRARTLILAIIACICLFWGAVDIVGVSARRLWLQLGEVSLGLLVLILIAGLSGFLWHVFRRRG